MTNIRTAKSAREIRIAMRLDLDIGDAPHDVIAGDLSENRSDDEIFSVRIFGQNTEIFRRDDGERQNENKRKNRQHDGCHAAVRAGGPHLAAQTESFTDDISETLKDFAHISP